MLIPQGIEAALEASHHKMMISPAAGRCQAKKIGPWGGWAETRALPLASAGR